MSYTLLFYIIIPPDYLNTHCILSDDLQLNISWGPTASVLMSLPPHKSCAVSMLQLMTRKLKHTTLMCPPVFVKISQLFQRLKRFTNTHKQHSDFKKKVC
jgi:hypothetical protein